LKLGSLLERRKKAVEAGVALTVHGLHTGAVVHMRDGGNRGTLLVHNRKQVHREVVLVFDIFWRFPEFLADGGTQEHVGAFAFQVEVGGGPFCQDGGREGTEAFAELDF
jgi:hypothetical protein